METESVQFTVPRKPKLDADGAIDPNLRDVAPPVV
jgi:hypothetical protein